MICDCRVIRSLFLVVTFAFSSHVVGKNVILFIGDGMGPNWTTAARSKKGGKGDGRLNLDGFSEIAIVQTASADNAVTDSAAAATAIATGSKTNNGVIGLDASSFPKGHPSYPQGKRGKRLLNLSEIAMQEGLKVGIVTTARITHATPAAFYAHHHSRNDEDEIAKQLLSSKIDLFLGGGRKFFKKNSLKAGKSSFKFIETRSGLRKFKGKGRVLGLFSKSHIPYVGTKQFTNAIPTLAEMTAFAINRLKGAENGFFLMVEGARIDHAGHDMIYEKGVSETLALDEAIGRAWNLVEQDHKLNAKNTLILVTADHETGGLVLADSPLVVAPKSRAISQAGSLKYPTLTTNKHTAVDVFAYAWGAHAHKIKGTLQNSDLFRIMRYVLLEPAVAR